MSPKEYCHKLQPTGRNRISIKIYIYRVVPRSSSQAKVIEIHIFSQNIPELLSKDKLFHTLKGK
jgi:hypothetical protein